MSTNPTPAQLRQPMPLPAQSLGKPTYPLKCTNRGADRFNLVCPVCGQEDPAVIDWATVERLAWLGANSLCVDCDPDAAQFTAAPAVQDA